MSSLTLGQRVYLWLGVPPRFDPQHRYVTSYLLSPFYLFLWRCLVGLFALFTCIYTAARDGGTTFSYFTVLTYWGIMGYLVVSAIHTGSFWWSYRRWQQQQQQQQQRRRSLSGASSRGEDEKTISTHSSSHGGGAASDAASYPRSWLESFPRPLQAAHALLVSTITTYPLIVTIVYWTILGNGNSFATPYVSYSNLSKHALNLAVSQLDVTILGRAPMRPWWHLLLVVVMIACYVGVAYITYATQGFYTYDFLNQGEHGTGIVTAYVIGIGVGTVLSFMIGQLLIFLREYLAAKLTKSEGGWGTARVAGVDDEALEPTTRGPGPEGEGGRIEGSQWRGRVPAAVEQ